MFIKFPSKPSHYLAPMLAFAAALLLLSRFLEFPTPSSSLPTPNRNPNPHFPFTDLIAAFKSWDAEIGCPRFRDKYKDWTANSSAVQDFDGGGECDGIGMRHVSVLVKGWTWVPDNLDNLYSCRCGLSCLWTKSRVLADRPDALLFESVMPPSTVSFVKSFELFLFYCYFGILVVS